MDCKFWLQATLGYNFFQLIAAIGATVNCKAGLQFLVAIIATHSWRMVAWVDLEFCAGAIHKKTKTRNFRLTVEARILCELIVMA